MVVYTARQVETALGLSKDFGWSIRKIGRETGIPKSVIGRWVKDPQEWKEKYRWNVPKYIKMDRKRLKSLKKFHAKVKRGKEVDPDKYKGLQIRYGDGDYEAYSG